MDQSGIADDGNPVGGAQFNSTDPSLNYHTEEAALFTQSAIDAKAKWAMINIDQNVKGLIAGMLAKLDEKYQVRS
jgi:hypothetical protein